MRSKANNSRLTQPFNIKGVNLFFGSRSQEQAGRQFLRPLWLVVGGALSSAMACLPSAAVEVSFQGSNFDLHPTAGLDVAAQGVTFATATHPSLAQAFTNGALETLATAPQDSVKLSQTLNPVKESGDTGSAESFVQGSSHGLMAAELVGVEPVGFVEPLAAIAPDALAQAPAPETLPIDSDALAPEPETLPTESEVPVPEPEILPIESEVQPPESGAQPPADNRWRFAAMPYFLVPLSVKVDATVAGRSASIRLDPGDILSLDRAFNAGLRLEGRRGRLGFFANGLYVYARQSGNVGVTFPAGSLTGFGIPVEVRTNTNGSIRIRQGTIDLAATYEAVNLPWGNQTQSPNPFRRLSVTPYAGLRISVLNERLQVNTVQVDGIPVPINPIPVNQTFSSTRTNVDPLIGAQIGLSLSPRWAVGLRGDVSGFNIGADRNLTWNLQALAQYHLSPRLSFQLGYYFNNSDYEDGTGLRRSRVKLRQNGFLLGAIFRF